MTQAHPPSEAQVPQAPQAPQAQAPSPDAGVPIEDRILTVQETENMLRGYGAQLPDDDTPPDQQQMAGDFFSEIPPEPQRQQALPPRPPGQDPRQIPEAWRQPQQLQQQQQAPAAPPQMPQAMLDAAVEQTLRSGAPSPHTPQAPAPGQQQVPPQQQPQDAALAAQNALLQQQVSNLTQQVQALMQQTQAPQAPQAQQPGAQPGADAQRFNFQVPPQFMAGLAAEDEGTRTYALNALLNGVAEGVAAQLRQEMQQREGVIQQQVQRSVSDAGLMQEIQRDMYGTYPELAPYRSFVQAAAQQVGTEHPALGNSWSQDLRDLIAERVSPMVPGLYQKVQQIRAQRLGSYAVPQQPGQPPQPLPQQQYVQQPLPQQQAMPSSLPPGVQPVGVMGGVHGQGAPVLARDAMGNLVHVQSPPQPYLGGPQARPDGRAVDPQVADIWHTLGFSPY